MYFEARFQKQIFIAFARVITAILINFIIINLHLSGETEHNNAAIQGSGHQGVLQEHQSLYTVKSNKYDKFVLEHFYKLNKLKL